MTNKREIRSTDGTLVGWLLSGDAATTGYVRLADCAEVQAGIRRIAELMSCMPIHLLQNSEKGDKRIKNELSRKIDISPCRYLSRQLWVQKIVKDMLLYGNSFHLPHYDGSMLADIQPLPASAVMIMENPGGYGYYALVNGVRYEHDELLHFVYNAHEDYPWRGQGLQVNLRHVAQELAQARKTSEKLMSEPSPSLIVKVDGLTEEFASRTGRETLANQYMDSVDANRPWFIPSEAFAVEQIKPLSLVDLAVPTSIEINKRTAASILGVPPYILGVGEFDSEAYNNFVETVLLPIARLIEPELTCKLLFKPEWYFQFSPRSLYAYSREGLTEMLCNLVDRAIITRNEARAELNRSPMEGLDELAILENYIPFAKISKQKKLKEDDKQNA